MRNWKNLFRDEPVAITGVVAAAVNVLLAFGVEVSVSALGAINLLIAAIFILVRWLVFSPSTYDESVRIAKVMSYELGRSDANATANLTKKPTTRKKASHKT